MKQWISAWGYQAMDYARFPMQAENKTLCVQFLNNVRGSALRILFSNRHGDIPLVLEHVQLLRMKGQTQWQDAVRMDVLLDGKARIEIPAKTELFSDEVELPVIEGQYLAVCMYIKEEQQIYTGCSCFPQEYNRVFVQDGNCMDADFDQVKNQVMKTGLLEIEPEHQCFFGAVRMDIQTEEEVKTITCFGDSITHRSLWTGPLAIRLYERYPGQVTLINCGLSGNRIVNDESPFSEFGPWFGKAAVNRFERDVFRENRVDLITVLLGINDIFHPLVGHAPQEEKATAQDLQNGLRYLIDKAHKRDVKVIGCTITAWKNCMGLFAEAPEKVRTDVNDWIRNSGYYDYVLDYDQMIADPSDPERMLPPYDSGDNVHPGPGGGLKIAESIDLCQIGKMLGLEGEDQ